MKRRSCVCAFSPALLFAFACSSAPPGGRDRLTNDGGDAGAFDGGTPFDGGTETDAGRPPLPPGIDCDDPVTAQTPWCAELCYEAATDLGWNERVRHKTRPAPRKYSSTCYDDMSPTHTYLWRAPADGQWVFDSASSEGSETLGVISATCSEQVYMCGGERPIVLSLAAGEPVFAITYHDQFIENRGSWIHQLQIVPRTDVEAGADCADGADNDADKLVDCADLDCATQRECNAPDACAEEIVPAAVPVQVEGELTEQEHQNRYKDCFSEYSRERLLAWRAPRAGRFVFDASKTEFRVSLQVHRGSCVGPKVGCRADDADSWGRSASAFTVAADAAEGEWFVAIVGGTDDANAFVDGITRQPVTHYVLEVREATDEAGHCFDGIDNDGNGEYDQFDPACEE